VLVLQTELFFAKVPPSLSTEAVAAVFNKFGSCSVNLFKRWPTARTSKVSQYSFAETGCDCGEPG
jgi:hypothetical protein